MSLPDLVRRLLARLRRLCRGRGLSPAELLVGAVAVLVALSACHRTEPGPVVVVDPGPPFGPPRVLGLRRTVDGLVLILDGKPSMR